MSVERSARPLLIAIDGPAGSGKSTLGRRLARALGLPYLNTGQMYRAVTSRSLDLGVDGSNGDALAELARTIRFDLDHESEPPSLMIDGAEPRPELIRADVEAAVSLVSRHPQVRAVLVGEQRRLGSRGAVVEGRDIGTVVFPKAAVKLFLDVNPAIRAARRLAERDAETDEAPEVTQALERRDALDARTNPLEPASDAVVLDNEGRVPDDVLREALSLVRERVPGA